MKAGFLQFSFMLQGKLQNRVGAIELQFPRDVYPVVLDGSLAYQEFVGNFLVRFEIGDKF